MTYQPRRLEIPIKIKGIDHVVIARENNDGQSLSYVYVLSAEENSSVNAGGNYAYPTINLHDGSEEHYFGELDIEDENVWLHTRNKAWAEAQADAHFQARFLQDPK